MSKFRTSSGSAPVAGQVAPVAGQLKTTYRDDAGKKNKAINIAETSVIIPLVLENYRPKKQILLAGRKPWQPVQVATDDQTSASTPLNISLAHRWMKLLETGQIKSVVDLADLLDRDISKLRKILKLADLEPGEVGKVMENYNNHLNSTR